MIERPMLDCLTEIAQKRLGDYCHGIAVIRTVHLLADDVQLLFRLERDSELITRLKLYHEEEIDDGLHQDDIYCRLDAVRRCLDLGIVRPDSINDAIRVAAHQFWQERQKKKADTPPRLNFATLADGVREQLEKIGVDGALGAGPPGSGIGAGRPGDAMGYVNAARDRIAAQALYEPPAFGSVTFHPGEWSKIVAAVEQIGQALKVITGVEGIDGKGDTVEKYLPRLAVTLGGIADSVAYRSRPDFKLAKEPVERPRGPAGSHWS